MPIVESIMGIQIIGNNGENIIKSPIVEAYIGSSLQDSTKVASDTPTDISTKVEQLMAAKHSHSNKAILDKFAESKDGKPTYDGKALGGGGGTSNFVVTVNTRSGDDGYTVTSASATFEEVDAAYKVGKEIIVKAKFEGMWYALGLTQVVEGSAYTFTAWWNGRTYAAGANSDGWIAIAAPVDSSDVLYISETLPDTSNVKEALDEIIDTQKTHDEDIIALGNAVDALDKKAHTHDNKSILDLISAADGKLQYNGSDVGLKGEKGDKGEPGTPGAPGTPGSDATVTKNNVVAALGYTPQAVSAQVATGTEITLADNTEYRLADVTTLTLAYPTGNFECWLKLTFAASGSITVTLPTGTKYIGNAPSFANGEVWEMSIKDGVVIAQKVGEGG